MQKENYYTNFSKKCCNIFACYCFSPKISSHHNLEVWKVLKFTYVKCHVIYWCFLITPPKLRWNSILRKNRMQSIIQIEPHSFILSFCYPRTFHEMHARNILVLYQPVRPEKHLGFVLLITIYAKISLLPSGSLDLRMCAHDTCTLSSHHIHIWLLTSSAFNSVIHLLPLIPLSISLFGIQSSTARRRTRSK